MDKQKRINWLNDRISSMEQCRDEIPFGLSDDESMELSAYKDSLASLTATAVGSFHIYDQKVDATTDYIRDGDWPIDEGELLVYTAPPVPEIKLPSDHEGTEHTEYHSGKQAGWNDCLAEIKRLNGWGE